MIVGNCVNYMPKSVDNNDKMSTKKSWIFVKSLEKVLKKSWIWFWKFCGHPVRKIDLDFTIVNQIYVTTWENGTDVA